MISSMFDQKFGLLCRGGSDFGILNNLDAASAVCPAQSVNLKKRSLLFGGVICDADEPCSANTA